MTMTGLFLCDLDMAGSHQLRHPNGRFSPVEAFQDASWRPSRMLCCPLWLPRDQLLMLGGLGALACKTGL